MSLPDQDNQAQVSERDGLRVTYNEDDSYLTLDWDPETHPEYNYLNDFPENELSEYLIGILKEEISKAENSLTSDKNIAHEECVAAYAASMGWEEVKPNKDVPTEEDMLRWTTLSQKLDRESPKKMALRGAICDYIDEMEVDEFIKDLISILIKEEIYFRNRADIYANLIEAVGQLAEKLGSSKDAE